MMNATAVRCIVILASAAVAVSGCASGHLAEYVEAEMGGGRYVLRWEGYEQTPDNEAGAWKWFCYEITSEKGCRTVKAWMKANREAIHQPDGMIPLRLRPGKELFCFQDNGTCGFRELRFWDKRRHLTSDAALRNWSKVELMQVNWARNLPVKQFESLQRIFERHGRPIEPGEDLDLIRDQHAAPSLVPDRGTFVLVLREDETSPPHEWVAYTVDDAHGHQVIAQWILVNYEALKCAYAVSGDLAVFPRQQLYWLDSEQDPDDSFLGAYLHGFGVNLLPYIQVVRKGRPDHWEWAENLPPREIETLKRLFRRYGKPTAFNPRRLYPGTGGPQFPLDGPQQVRLFQRGTEVVALDDDFSANSYDASYYANDLAGGWFVLRWEERQGPPDDTHAPSEWLCYVLDDSEGYSVVKRWIRANHRALSVPEAMPHLRVVPTRQLAWCHGEVVSGCEPVWPLWLTAPDGSPNRSKLDLLTGRWVENLPTHEFERIKGIFSEYGRPAAPNRADLVSLLGPAQHPPVCILHGGSFVLRIEKRSDEGYKWVNYRIDDRQGRGAVEDWIALNYEALVCAEASQRWNPARARPPRELYWFDNEAKTRLEMEGRTFVSRGEEENYEHIEGLAADQFDRLLRIFKEHGKVVDFDPIELAGRTRVRLKCTWTPKSWSGTDAW